MVGGALEPGKLEPERAKGVKHLGVKVEDIKKYYSLTLHHNSPQFEVGTRVSETITIAETSMLVSGAGTNKATCNLFRNRTEPELAIAESGTLTRHKEYNPLKNIKDVMI